MPNTVLDKAVRKAGWLDPVVKVIQAISAALYKPFGPLRRPLEDLVHGTKPLGHPLHPALTDIPIGALVGVVSLDIAAHYTATIPHGAATVVLWVAVIAALLAVHTGYQDFTQTFGHEARVAVVHGLVMTVAWIAMIVSLVMRTAGGDQPHTVVVGLDLAALALMSSGGYIGGHLVFAIGTAVNRTAFLEGSSKFVDVGAESDFAEGSMTKVDAKGLAVLVTRREGALCAIANLCSHAGGPLDEGKLDNGRVTCPWHGSVFDACTGKVVHGPATSSQPAMTVEVKEGRVRVKPAVPLH
jgi:nitrite reductase/ring-hydroxylating ferredoxin subunit/uncharacterized membrane protein